MLVPMLSSETYGFRPITSADAPLLKAWRRAPHVHAWWGAEDEEDEVNADSALVRRWIVSHQGCPFAYMQDYAVQGWDFEHYFAHLPAGSRGIDQYIGKAKLIGQGHGPGFIAQHVARLFTEGVPSVATDPDPKNKRAIRAYEKAGFHIFGEAFESPWGRVLPMKIVSPTNRPE